MSLPCGTRNHSYAEDMAIVRTKTQWVFMIGFLVLLFTMPAYLGNYWLGVINLFGVWVIAATGLNILTGYCGQLSIGHAGFVAVGAYTSGILTTPPDLIRNSQSSFLIYPEVYRCSIIFARLRCRCGLKLIA